MKLKNISAILFSATIALLAITSAPVHATGEAITLDALQKQCIELQKQDNKHEYIPVVGKIKINKFQRIPEDCFPVPGQEKKCDTNNQMQPLYSGQIDDTNIYGESTKINFSTNWLKTKEIEYIEKLKVKAGEFYGFCGELEERKSSKDAPSFHVRDARSLQPIINK